MKTNQPSGNESVRGVANHTSSRATASFPAPGYAAQLMQVIQMAITDVIQIGVATILQPTSNVCWATSGWCIHSAKGGTVYSSLRDFVQGQGDAEALRKFDADEINDIDDIIGSGSNTNHLKGSDSSGDFAKSAISRELNAGRPILANVNNNHYVVICGKRKNGSNYELEIMDPGTGSKSWVSTSGGSDNSHIGQAGGFTLSVLYYTN
jgi:Papain-like cysteine protease AvrRpt2